MSLRRLLYQLFPPASAREVMDSIDALCKGFDMPIADEIGADAKRIVRRAGPVSAPESAGVIAARLLQLLAANRLRSGQNHVYRGVLSDRGRMLLSFHDACVDVRTKIGDREAHEVAALMDKAMIRQDIQGVG